MLPGAPGQARLHTYSCILLEHQGAQVQHRLGVGQKDGCLQAARRCSRTPTFAEQCVLLLLLLLGVLATSQVVAHVACWQAPVPWLACYALACCALACYALACCQAPMPWLARAKVDVRHACGQALCWTATTEHAKPRKPRACACGSGHTSRHARHPQQECEAAYPSICAAAAVFEHYFY